MMRVLISQRIIFSEKGAQKDALEQDYVRYYESHGITLIPVPNSTSSLSEYFNMDIQRIILSGGNDICGAPIDKHDECSCMRATIEIQLLQYAMKNNISVLAECRGCQFLNLFFGGTLTRDLALNVKDCIGHVGTAHRIEICDSGFQSILHCKEAEVNSFHNHGFTEQDLSSHLMAFARSQDGVIEGVYHPSYPIMGIMWHPERMAENVPINTRIIERFKAL